jgi:hypothetical protein
VIDNTVGEILRQNDVKLGKWGDLAYTTTAMLVGGLAAEAAGHDGVVAAQAAQNAAQNNFLNTRDKARRDELREQAKNGWKGMSLSEKQAAAAELLMLETWDQTSDYYLWLVQNEQSLRKGQQYDFEQLLNRYVAGEQLVTGASEREIVKSLFAAPVASPTEHYYYVGPQAARDTYLDALTDKEGWFAVRFYPGREQSSEEQLFYDIVIPQSGHLSYSFDDLLPSQLSLAQFYARIDTIRNSPLAATFGLIAYALDASSETQDAVMNLGAATDGVLMGFGGIAAGRGDSVLPAGLNPLLGGRTIGTPGSTLYVTEPWGNASGGGLKFTGDVLTKTGWPSYGTATTKGSVWTVDTWIAETAYANSGLTALLAAEVAMGGYTGALPYTSVGTPLNYAWLSGQGLTELGALSIDSLEAGSIRYVNPGYPMVGRTHNCVNCAIATDATLAGNPASALPINSTGGVSIRVLESQYGMTFSKPISLENITQEIASAGPGARGIVFGSYGQGQPGHVFNVVGPEQSSTR